VRDFSIVPELGLIAGKGRGGRAIARSKIGHGDVDVASFQPFASKCHTDLKEISQFVPTF
jgi:hypothetical protein